MSEQRRLLVPRDAEDGHALAEKGLCRDAVVMSRRINLGQHNARNAEQPQKLVVPRQGMNIEQHGARSVCIVSGKDFSLAQMPHEKGVHRTEQQLAPFRPVARPPHVVEYPFQLGGGKIRIGHESRFFVNKIGQSVGFKPFAKLCGTPALPYYRVANRLSRNFVPDKNGFALIGYAYCAYFVNRYARPYQRFGYNAYLTAQYILGVVLHPAVKGINLSELLLRHACNPSAFVENYCARACSPLVKRKNILQRFSSHLKICRKLRRTGAKKLFRIFARQDLSSPSFFIRLARSATAFALALNLNFSAGIPSFSERISATREKQKSL